MAGHLVLSSALPRAQLTACLGVGSWLTATRGFSSSCAPGHPRTPSSSLGPSGRGPEPKTLSKDASEDPWLRKQLLQPLGWLACFPLPFTLRPPLPSPPLQAPSAAASSHLGEEAQSQTASQGCPSVSCPSLAPSSVAILDLGSLAE